MISTQVFLSLISTAGRELAMLEDVAGIVEALQDVNVEISGGFGYDPSTRTLGLGMTGVDGLGLEAFRASVVLVAQGLDVRQSLAHSQQTAKDAMSSFLATAKTAAQDVRQQFGGSNAVAAPGAPSPPSDDDARRLQNTLNRAAAERLAARAAAAGDCVEINPRRLTPSTRREYFSGSPNSLVDLHRPATAARADTLPQRSSARRQRSRQVPSRSTGR